MITLTKYCEYCAKEYNKPVTCSKTDWSVRRFCSAACRIAVLGKSNLGKKFSEETKEKMRQASLRKPTGKSGAEHHLWKGGRVGYFALHGWVKRQLGRPMSCEKCGREGHHNFRIQNGKQVGVWNIQWANKSGAYKRNLTDWLKLCISCHKKYDLTKQYA